MRTISTEELVAMRKDDPGLTLINTLSASDFEKKHIPNSINIPFDSDGFADLVEEEMGDKSSPVVVYCASINCNASATAAKELEAAGFTNVYDYETGMLSWENAGKPVESGSAVSAR